jgi:hypothetical protein
VNTLFTFFELVVVGLFFFCLYHCRNDGVSGHVVCRSGSFCCTCHKSVRRIVGGGLRCRCRTAARNSVVCQSVSVACLLSVFVCRLIFFFLFRDFLQQIQGYLNAGDVDMYRFRIRYPTQFSATTTDTTGLVGAVNDTILTLFYTDGFPIAKNDDISAVNLLSTLPALNSLYALLAPGDYLLAVSIYNNLPLTGASAIWTSENFVGVFPPDFPGNVTGWTNEAVTTGSYRITLTGADRFSDCPNVPPPQLPIPILFPAP